MTTSARSTKPFHSLRLHAAFLLTLAAQLMSGCGSHPVSSTSTIVITAANASIAAGQTTQLTATEHDSGGQTTDVTSQVTWASSNAAVATVNTHGLLTGIAAGSTSISATLGSVNGTFTVTIGKAVATKLTVTPASPQIYTGASQQFTATATFSDGTKQNLSSSVTWSVTPTTAATINSAGLLQAVAAGSFTVTATSGSLTASVSGTITNPTVVSIAISPASTNVASGKTQQFVATGTYNDGSNRDLTSSVTWASSNNSVLSISNSGLATAAKVAATTAVTITAQLNSLSASAAVNVTPHAAVAALIVTPTSSSIAPGSAIQQRATAHYTDGTAQDVTSQVTWSVSASTLAGGSLQPAASRLANPRDTSTSTASVNQTGIAYAAQPGAANVTATLGSVQTSSVLLVRNTTIKALTISTPVATLPVTATQQLTLAGLFADGSTQDLSLTANWQSTDPTIATISSTGLVTAVAAGTTTFTASFGGLSATSGTVQILSASLVSLTIKAPNPVTNVGAVQQLSVIGVFTNGQSQDLTPLASWKSSDTSVFQINSSGFMDAAGTGTAQITATVGNFSTVSNFAALNTTIVSILVLPPTGAANYALGTSLQFNALVTLSSGAQIDLTNAVTWTAADPTVMTIDQNGLAKSGKVGSTTIKATLQGFSGSATSVVTNATLTQLVIAPTAAQIAASTHAQFTATGWFSDGTVEDVSNDVLWSVLDSTVGTVDNNGTVLGIASGNSTVKATSQSLTATAPLVVTNAVLSSTIITPGNFELPVNVHRQLYLVGNFSDGTTQDMSADAIWISPSPSVLYTSQLGDCLSKQAGIGTVGAVLGNFTSSTQVTVTNATLTALSLTPASTTIREQGSQQMRAVGTFSDGYKQDLYLNAVFFPANYSLVYIRANGLAIGTGIGSTQITAEFLGMQATTTNFTVLSGDLQTLALTPANPRVTAGGSAQLTAIGTYADSTTSDLSNQVTWTSSNPGVLSVNTNGLATAHQTTIPVTVTVTAASGTVRQSVTVTVFPSSESRGSITALRVQPTTSTIGVGSTRPFVATATYADGTSGDVTGTAAWTSLGLGVAQIDTSGLATGVGLGSTIITATANGIAANATLTVGQAPASVATLTSIALTPSSATFSPGSTQLFTATATYSDGTIDDISSSVVWQSSNPAAVTINTDGVATGVALGSATIAATASGVTGNASVTVSIPTLESLTVSPATAQITSGNTQQFTATGNYSDQSQKDLTSTIAWSSSNPSLLTISSTGVATVGNVPVTSPVTVMAQTGSFSATAAVTLNPPAALTSLVVKPTSSSIAPGSAVQQTATAYYADGTTQDVTNDVTWSVSASSLSGGNFRRAAGRVARPLLTSTSTASVDQTGVVYATQTGAANVQASLGSLQAQSIVLVRNTTVQSIRIGTPDTSLPVGATQQLSLTGAFADGSTQDLTLTANWQSANPAVATINSRGVVTAVNAGTVQFTASFGGLAQSTPAVHISATALVSTTLKVPYPVVNAGSSEQLSLIGVYADGTSQDLTSLAIWKSSDSTVLQTSSTGFVQAVATGKAQITATLAGFSAVASIEAFPATLVSVVVLPVNGRFALGTSLQFTALATFSNGSQFDISPVALWTATDPTVMTINATGLAKSGKVGTTTVSATFQGISGTSTSTSVTGATLTKIAINPASARFAASTHAWFTVTGFFSDGTVQDVSNDVVWTVSDPTIASIDSTGSVYGIAAGNATLTASAQSVTAVVPLTVTNATLESTVITPGNVELPVSVERQFYLVGNFSDGSTQDMSPDAIWLAPTPTVVFATQKTGIGIGVAPGVGTLAAQLGNFTAATPVTVTNVSLTGITLTPANTTVRQQGSQQMTATGTFSDGFRQNISLDAVLTAANPGLVYLNQQGLVIGTGVGSTQITASFDNLQSSPANFTVLSGTLDSISLAPANPSVTAGGEAQLTATGTYADGTTQNLSQQVTWTSSDPAVLSVDANGLATAHATNTPVSVTVTATSGTTTQSFTVTVSPSSESSTSITALAIQPSSAVIGSGSTRQFIATATYADGSTANVSGTTTWSVANSSVATFNNSGLATGVGTGGTLVTATSNGISANASLTVQKAAPSIATLISITVAPSSATINPGATQLFTATGTYSDGTIEDISSSVAWQSSAPAVATVNSAGLATGVSGGTATISAQWQSVSGTAALTVSSVAPSVTSVHVTPLSATIPVGGTQQFAAVATLAGGGTLNVTSSATWSSSSPAVATINQSGLATGVASGSTAVAATYSGFSGNASVIVNNGGTGGGTNPPLTSITVTPASTSITVGATQQYVATGTYADGSTANITSTATWTSSSPATASITTAGLATGVAAGTTAISAQSGGLSGSTALTVTASSATLTSLVVTPTSSQIITGLSQQFAATGTYSDGTTRDLSASATWSTSNAQVATVDSSGQVTGVSAGTATITGTSGSLHSQATVIINAATLQSLAISPSGASFAIGAQQQLKLIGTYSNGSRVDLTFDANWSSQTPAVATVTSDGLVTGAANGTTRISASFQSQTGSTTVQVTPATLASIAISPSSAQFAKGTTQQFSVTGTYSDGSTHDVTGQATYLGSNSSVLTVSSTGLATATGAGTATISVNDAGVTAATQTLTVTPATLVSIAITPANPTFANGTTQKFTATGTFSDGTTQDLSNQVVWTSSNPQTATINDNGLATSGASGSTAISATFDGVTGTSGTAKVTSATLSSLAVTPANSQIAKGTTQQFTATGTFSDATTQNLSTQVTWSTSSASVASVDANGLATGIIAGSAQISAAFGNTTASTASFLVTSATLVSIAFSPSSPVLAQGTSTQETVTGTFSDGSTQNLTSSAVFSSPNAASVTVSNSGLITAVAPGSSTVSVSVDGVTNTFTAAATSATLSSITITPANPPSFAKGTTEQFTATGHFSDNSTQNISSTVTWSTSSSAVMTVDTNGLATGAGTGSATITAAWQSKTATTPSVTVTPAVVASISVTPAGASLTTGANQQYTATATYTDASTGNVTNSATWTSSSTTVATISSTGLAVAVAPGSTTIAAQVNSVSGSTGLTVTAVITPTLNTITITPSSPTVAKGNTQQFTATGTYSDGSTQNLTTQVTWGSSVTAVATINNQGLATAVNGGNAQISATYQGVTGVTTLTVSSASLVSLSVTPSTATIAAGTAQQYHAVGTLSDGSTQDLTNSVTWSSSNNGVATINSAGLARGMSAGTATMTAQAGSVSGTAALTVTSATAVSVQVLPATIALPIGGMQQLSVTAVFSDGTSQNVTNSATYQTANTGVANINVLGNVTATGAGTTSLTVSQGSASTTVPVAVTSATLTAITVSPSTLTLPVGGSEQMTATGSYSDGSTENLTNSVVWSSSAPTVATVSTTGKVQVSQIGSATITASLGTTSGTSAVTGTSAVITSIVVSPAGVTLAVGQTQQYTATATLSNGTQQNVTSSANWSTSDTTKGTISNVSGSNGLLLATGAGSLSVTATMNSISGSTTATVTNAVLTSLTVSPSPVSLPAGTTQQLTVTGNYSDGSTANVTSSATWASSNAAVASVSTSGVLNGVSTGSATVTATDGAVNKTDAVTVTNATLSSITITPANSSAPLGVHAQLTATGTYSDGSTANLTSQVQWSSSTPAVATVSSSGLVSTLAAGSTQITATLNSVSGQTPFTVSAAALESISVQATQSSFALGLSLQLTAIGTYSDSSTQNITNLVSWSSQTPSVGVVSSTGVATGVTTGSFNAQAALSGVTGTLSLTVTNAVLQSIVITPNNPTIVNVLGSQTQFTATGHYSDGTTQNITDSCHWAITSGLSVGSISQTGSFSAIGIGVGTLSATSGSISGTDNFTVISVGL